MIRILFCVAVILLVTGNLYSEDKTDSVKKENTEAKTEPAKPQDASKRRVRGGGEGHRGKVTKASMENGVIKLVVDGTDYEFTVSDNTHAMIRTTEKDGKEVVVGLQLTNADGRKAGRKTDGQKRKRPKTNS